MSQSYSESRQNSTGPDQNGSLPSLNIPSLTALILGILSIVTLGCFLLGIPAIIFGILGLRGVTNSAGAQKGKGLAYAGVLLGIVSLFVQAGFFVYVSKQEDASPYSFRKAEKKIASRGGDEIGFGNNNEATLLAESFTKKLELMSAVMFSGKNATPGVPLTDGEFRTYCLLNDDSCVFMVHIPNLRKYDAAARDSFADMAWRAANGILAKHQFQEGNQVAVGTKGVVNYHRIDLGKFFYDMDSVKNKGIENSGYTSSLLESFFPKPGIPSLLKSLPPRP